MTDWFLELSVDLEDIGPPVAQEMPRHLCSQRIKGWMVQKVQAVQFH